MKICAKYFKNSISIARVPLKFGLYESNIEPLIRFIHSKDINPSGWIEIPENKYKTNRGVKQTKCKRDVVVKWNDVISLKSRENIAPMLIASFDIECTSSHGDFPVAIKQYDKVAREIIHAFNEKKDNCNNIVLKEFLKDSLIHLFTDKVQEHIAHLYSDIYFKTKPKVSFEKIGFCIDDLFSILNGKLLYKNNHNEHFSNKNCDDDDEDSLSKFNKQFKRHGGTLSKQKQSVIDHEQQEEVKYSVFDDLNSFLRKQFPPIKGDSIIQIGTTFHRYGSSDCHFKHVITLDSCSDIDGVDEVVSCNKESDVLIEWTKMINRYDPDVITGYNIFGFDMQYTNTLPTK